MEKIQVNYEEMYNRSDEIEFLKKQFDQYKKEAYFFNSSAEEIAFCSDPQKLDQKSNFWGSLHVSQMIFYLSS